MMDIEIIPLLRDNYGYLLMDKKGTVAIIDPGEAAPVIAALEKKGLTLDYILNTHHHWDHTDGNNELRERYGCQIVGPASEDHRIDHLDIGLKEGDSFSLGGSKAEIIETPGHTSGHICFWFPEDKVVFTGDTLFSMGIGRLFEGTPAQMWNSLSKIAALPDDTMVYCGHEYTQMCGRFARQIEPENKDIERRLQEVKALRAANKPTLPVPLGTEKKTNVYLRAGSGENLARLTG